MGCFLLKKDNVSCGAGYVDDESTDELDPNRVCVPDLVVEENCEQSTVRDNERPPEFHDATIHPDLCDHKRWVGPFTVDVTRPLHSSAQREAMMSVMEIYRQFEATCKFLHLDVTQVPVWND